ncbi:MAG: ABC transporter substrate-binding protein [Pseudomonadota bacterium]|nr:ABC transporter substrate-binding protein [Pseudomonadota bacterium]
MTSANTKRLRVLGLLGAAVIAGCGLVAEAEAQPAPMKITVTAVGRPPIFSNTFIDVAESLGYFKDAGLDVTMRWFQRAADTAKIILTGEADVGWTATTPGLNLMASGGEVVAIAGQNTQDWLVASNAPDVKTCSDLKSKTVAADGINNARYLYLGAVLESCKLSLKDVTPIDLANAALVKAGIAGQVHNGVFHVDELAEIAFRTGQDWHQIPAPASIAKDLHYGMILTTPKEIANNHEALVRFVEVWIRTQRFMSSPAPQDKEKFAAIVSKASQIDPKVAMKAIEQLQAIGYWQNNLGLDKDQMMRQEAQLVATGTIKKPDAPSFDRIVNPSIYEEASKRLQNKPQ